MTKPIFLLNFLLFFFSCTDSETKHRTELQQIASQLNELCPKRIDSETELSAIEVEDPNTLVYTYVLVNVPSNRVDTLEFYRLLWPGIISNIKVSPEFKKLRDHDTRIEYRYFDKEKRYICRVVIRPEDYEGK